MNYQDMSIDQLVSLLEEIDSFTNDWIEKLNVTRSTYTIIGKLRNVKHHVDLEKSGILEKTDDFLIQTTGAFNGIKWACNAALNGSWTHTQKNAQIQAMALMCDTVLDNIANTRKNTWYWGLTDVYAPNYSMRGMQRRIIELEHMLEKNNGDKNETR